ncbi:putative Amidophosphoribosyltransferase [Streptomyces misionensis JCM 4497]
MGERPADVPRHRARLDRARPQRQPGQHGAARRDGRRTAERQQQPLHPGRGHQRHRPADGPAGRPGRRGRQAADHRGGRPAGPPEGAGRVLARLHGRAHPLRRPRPPGHPPVGPRPSGARLGGRLRDRRPRHRGRQLRPGDRAGRVRRHRRERPAQLAVRGSKAQGLCLRVCVPGPPGHRHRRPERVPLPRGDGPPARQGGPGRGRPGDSDPGVGHPGRHRLRGGVRHPLRRRSGEERLRGPHLHPALADHPPAGHPAEAEPAQGSHQGQAPGRRGRLDRARQHPARPGPHAPRGGRGRGAHPDLLAAGEVALLLRHRLRDPRGADRQRHDDRRDRHQPRRRLARLHLHRRHDRRDHHREAEPVPRLLRRRVPDGTAGPGAARQAAAGDRAGGRSGRDGRGRRDPPPVTPRSTTRKLSQSCLRQLVPATQRRASTSRRATAPSS